MAQQEKNRYWTFICYPDSAPSNWVEILEQSYLPIAISPLHDQDLNESVGELKKPHWHVLACWDGPTTYKKAFELSQKINGTHPQAVASVKGSYDYWIHKNNPEKHQYSDDGRINLNGFLITNYSNLSSQEEVILKKEIFNFIIANDINEYFKLCCRLQSEDLIAFDYVTKHTLLFDRFICSRRNFVKEQVNNLLSDKD